MLVVARATTGRYQMDRMDEVRTQPHVPRQQEPDGHVQALGSSHCRRRLQAHDRAAKWVVKQIGGARPSPTSPASSIAAGTWSGRHVSSPCPFHRKRETSPGSDHNDKLGA
jgi:hypothetical protein